MTVKKVCIQWECPSCGTERIEEREFIVEECNTIKLPRINCPCGRRKGFTIKDIFIKEGN
jgi:hypothetical protein